MKGVEKAGALSHAETVASLQDGQRGQQKHKN